MKSRLPRVTPLAALLCLLLARPTPVFAQHLEVTVFAGAAFPILDGRLVLRAPGVPSIPGLEVTAKGTPELRTDGGAVVGGAAALEFGLVAIEARLDTTRVGFDVAGARYDLRTVGPELPPLTGSVTIGDGRLDLRRLDLVSFNLRLRTPGPIGLIASGGLSYLPDIQVTGSAPVTVDVAGLPLASSLQPRLTLVATPDQPAHRWGVNAGAGLRVGGRVSFVAEGRVFYFRPYDLRFVTANAVPFISDLVAGIAPIRFNPIILNAQAGLSFRF